MWRLLVSICLLIFSVPALSSGWFFNGDSVTDPAICGQRAGTEPWNYLEVTGHPGLYNCYVYLGGGNPCNSDHHVWNQETFSCDDTTPEECQGDPSVEQIVQSILNDGQAGQCYIEPQTTCETTISPSQVGSGSVCNTTYGFGSPPDTPNPPPDSQTTGIGTSPDGNPQTITTTIESETTSEPGSGTLKTTTTTTTTIETLPDGSTEHTVVSETERIFTPENGGPTTTTNVRSETDSAGVTTTTLTGYSESNTGNGSGGGSGNGSCDPTTDPDCQSGGSVTGGINCDAAPTCEGDPIECAIVDQNWRNRCRIGWTGPGIGENCATPYTCDGDPITCANNAYLHQLECNKQTHADGILAAEQAGFDQLVADEGQPETDGDGVLTSLDKGEINFGSGGDFDLGSVFNQSGGSASCPDPRQLNLSLGSYDLSYQFLCDVASDVSPLVVLIFSYLASLLLYRAIQEV